MICEKGISFLSSSIPPGSPKTCRGPAASPCASPRPSRVRPLYTRGADSSYVTQASLCARSNPHMCRKRMFFYGCASLVLQWRSKSSHDFNFVSGQRWHLSSVTAPSFKSLSSTMCTGLNFLGMRILMSLFPPLSCCCCCAVLSLCCTTVSSTLPLIKYSSAASSTHPCWRGPNKDWW